MHYQLPFMYPLTDPPIPHYLQVLITLKYIATGSFQLTVSDCHEVSQSSVSRCITHVCRAVTMLLPHLIKMPAPNDSLKVMEDFKNRGNLPGVIGCINYSCDHISKPPGNRFEAYRNRKSKLSVCGPHLQFFNIVARWSGSAHDSNIFNNSRLCASD